MHKVTTTAESQSCVALNGFLARNQQAGDLHLV